MPDPSKLTPVFANCAAKQQFPMLLLFRMGDFYEIFGEDVQGSRARPGADADQAPGGIIPPLCGAAIMRRTSTSPS